ncbi:hypothetical protein UFOVP45_54 [uncultured Caudovirales phage]|uniref:SWIM-type domain-containing protein n=1 Tax=uncultured Caudovirales phage TaxID=2100421 RepID=A0A6J5KRM4_9CAUD|nr:hypothetical protein UFOVP45_54 [uncultured Caudovirales phage]
MKETAMDIDWRTVQLFLEDDGVCEVEVDADNHDTIRCTCKSYKSSSKCKHSKYVRKSMEENNGAYSIRINNDVPEDEALQAMSNSVTFRDFVIKYAKVEVI